MKKILLTLLIATTGLFAMGQTFPYNNEWIDYSKTYYKFYIGKTGLYRISQATLTSVGIGILRLNNSSSGETVGRLLYILRFLPAL